MSVFKNGTNIMNDDYLKIDLILPELKANNQKQLYQVISDCLSDHTEISKDEIYSYLMEHNNSGTSSGIGNGVAILHSIHEKLHMPVVLFARATHLIEYDSVDGDPIDLIFHIASPESDRHLHLQRLAKISRLARNGSLCTSLRNADSKDAIQAILFDLATDTIAA